MVMMAVRARVVARVVAMVVAWFTLDTAVTGTAGATWGIADIGGHQWRRFRQGRRGHCGRGGCRGVPVTRAWCAMNLLMVARLHLAKGGGGNHGRRGEKRRKQCA